jgi:transcription initiation factor TFIIB
MVLHEELLDRTPEWRAFTHAKRNEKVRVGPSTSLTKYDKGFSTTFQPYRDTYGKALPMKERLKMQRLQKWDIRARMYSSAMRNLSQAMYELKRLTEKLNLPQSVVENAALIYRRALSQRLIRGRSINSIAAASLYAACRLTQTPRSLNTIVEASTKPRKEIARFYRLLQRELKLSMPTDNSDKYLSKIASKVELTQQTQNLAIELLHRAKQIQIDIGKSPMGMAATALYIASIINGHKITQKELAEAAQVTEVTIRNRYKDLDKILGLGLKDS